MTLGPGEHFHDEDIYPEALGHAVPEPLPLTDFAPWHLPRKQWVRTYQWRLSASQLAQKLLLDDRPLRYVGLPGTELLDLDVLATFCAGKGIRFRYLGFNSGAQGRGAQTTQHLAEGLVRAIDGVDPLSIVCTDDIISLASKSSLAYARLTTCESFDVVNLDLCNVFTTKQGSAVHAAVKNLLEYQVNGRTQPWLMFITTAIDRSAVSSDDVSQYQRKFDDNSARWATFRRLVNSIAGCSQTGQAAFATATGMRFGKLLAVAIGKWIAAVLKEPFHWKVELKSCVGYRRGMTGIPEDRRPVPEPELFSMVFGIGRPPQMLVDPQGIAPSVVQVTTEDWEKAEHAMALQMAKKAERTLDLDVHLQGRPQEYAQLTDESASLLSFRNYDVTAYRRFASSIARI